MDFMFEDDVDEVGSDVEAYCPKCKADTTHVVISKYEDEIRRVQCNPCGDVHSFRKPRGEAEEDMPEPVAARKRALLKKLTWEEFFAKHGERNAKPYEFRETYRENAIVFHPKFGKGYVSELVSESKVEITFSDARRILVHNRKDIPGSPVGREDDGLPSTPLPVKAGAKSAGKAVEKQGVKVPESKPAAPTKPVVAKAPAGKHEKLIPAKMVSKKVAGGEPPVDRKAPAKKVPPSKAAKKAEKKAAPKKTEKKAPPKKVAKKVEKKAEKKPAKSAKQKRK
jgi:Zn ribbon nucleic-acid-binding protein